MSSLEIQPASVQQVLEGRGGKMITIEEDVCDVAKRLKGIDRRFYLRFSEAGGYFVVYCREDHEQEGTGHLIATYQELDARIVEDIERIVWENRQPGYSYSDEIEKNHQLADDARDYEFSQKIMSSAEELARAIRVDLGSKGPTFITKDIPKGK